MVKERLQLIANTDTCHPAEIDAVGGHFLGFDKLAIKDGKRSLQDGSAGYQGFPLAMRKAVGGRDIRKSGKDVGYVLLPDCQGVEREYAVFQEQVVARI